LRLLLGLLARLADHPGGLETHLLPHVGQEHLLGVFEGEAGDPAELVVQVGCGAPGPVALLATLGVRLLRLPLALLEGPLARAQPRLLLIQTRVALLKCALTLVAFPDLVLQLLLETGLRSEEHTSELQSRFDLVCRLLLEKKNTKQ